MFSVNCICQLVKFLVKMTKRTEKIAQYKSNNPVLNSHVEFKPKSYHSVTEVESHQHLHASMKMARCYAGDL